MTVEHALGCKVGGLVHIRGPSPKSAKFSNVIYGPKKWLNLQTLLT